MPSNTAAWLITEKATSLEVKEAPYNSPNENEIVIKNGAVAINPADWAIQARGNAVFPLSYPAILGLDVAGEVAEVGSGVTRFKVGDRVLGQATGFSPTASNASRGFQLYTNVQSNVAAEIPSTMSYENACVIPEGISVAACGMFDKSYLGLQYPTVPPRKPTGKTLLIWGGSTSCGCNAVQLGVSAGYEVFSTASPKNFDYVKKLGASKVFDYNSPTVVSELIHAFEGKDCAGAVAIGSALTMFTAGVAEACAEVVSKTEGKKFVATAMFVPKELPAGVEAKFIAGSSLKDNELGKIIYEDFLPNALTAGQFVAAPEPLVVGKGLEHIQAAFEVQRKGVSAKKVVVSL